MRFCYVSDVNSRRIRGFASPSPTPAPSRKAMPKRSAVHDATAADRDTPAEQWTTKSISSAQSCSRLTNARMACACDNEGAKLSEISQYVRCCSSVGSFAQDPGG